MTEWLMGREGATPATRYGRLRTTLLMQRSSNDSPGEQLLASDLIDHTSVLLRTSSWPRGHRICEIGLHTFFSVQTVLSPSHLGRLDSVGNDPFPISVILSSTVRMVIHTPTVCSAEESYRMPFKMCLLSISNSNRLTVFGLWKLFSWFFGLWSHMVLMGTRKEKWILSWHDLWVNLSRSAILGALSGEERGDSVTEPWIPPWSMPMFSISWTYLILQCSMLLSLLEMCSFSTSTETSLRFS